MSIALDFSGRLTPLAHLIARVRGWKRRDQLSVGGDVSWGHMMEGVVKIGNAVRGVEKKR